MPSTTPTARHPQSTREKGLLGKILELPFSLFGILLVALFFSVLSEWFGLLLFWPEEGWQRSRDMLDRELAWICAAHPASLLLEQPEQTARWIITQVYEWCFERTGLIDWISRSGEAARSNDKLGSGLRSHVGRVHAHIESYGLAAVYAVLTFLLRLLILTLTLPLVLMVLLGAVVDGLVRRDLRRFGAGRESGFIYHRAKRLIAPLWVAPWIIYLALPFSVNPLLVTLPGALALGLAVSISVGSFKKYL
ncbi:integrating conjugative element membrane protein, PFL_4697 family [Pseudomonas asplenii]|nr:integrating conjugative element membrane protein, PFL_4697 family [Pseudomonas fuscovaginae]